MPDMSMDIWQALKGPFDPGLIHWRPGSVSKAKGTGLALAYLDARDIQERLDDVLGPENWSDHYHQAGSSIICELSIKVEDGSWLTKSDGAGESDIEGSKGAISGAFKRAAVKFGVGRYLYYAPDWWYPLIAPDFKWFTDEAKRKMTLDIGAWQRDFFGGNLDGEIRQEQAPQQQYQGPQAGPAPTPVNGNAGVYPAKPSADLEAAYKEFQSEMARANLARRGDGVREIRPYDILFELRSMNFPVPQNMVITNWQQLKEFGHKALVALVNELANRPVFIGGDSIPF